MISPAAETIALVALTQSAASGSPSLLAPPPSMRVVGGAARRGQALSLLEERYGLLADELLGRASACLRSWRRRGIAVLSAADAAYPVNLRPLADRPPLLFTVGELVGTDGAGVAVIGTRSPTPHGVRVAQHVADGLVAAGRTVISGLAAGIDTAAHATALTAGGRTVAVLGTGVDRCYPPENAGLQREISRRCAILSSFPPGSPPTRHSFPARNVVMSGIACATVIVEASAMSGTRIQARAALAQRRPLLIAATLLNQEWAAELAERNGVWTFEDSADVPELVTEALAGIGGEAVAASAGAVRRGSAC